MREAHGTVRKVLLYFAQFLPQAAEQRGRGWRDVESMIGSKEQDETTAALFDSRWSKWPRHEVGYDDEQAKWAYTDAAVGCKGRKLKQLTAGQDPNGR